MLSDTKAKAEQQYSRAVTRGFRARRPPLPRSKPQSPGDIIISVYHTEASYCVVQPYFVRYSGASENSENSEFSEKMGNLGTT